MTDGLTRREAVAQLGPDVTVHMVSMWACRGWLDPHTGQRRHLRVVGKAGRARLYHPDDLHAAEAATGRHPNSRRRVAA